MSRVRSLVFVLFLSACGGRTDVEAWSELGESVGSDSGGKDTGGNGTGGRLNSGGNPGVGPANGGGGVVVGTGGFSDGVGGIATGGVGGMATGGTGGMATGGAGGMATGGTFSVEGDVFVDCETTIENGDGFSWATPLKHPVLAIPGREDGDTIYLKAGTCHAWNDPSEPLLVVPNGLSVTLAGGYNGDNLNDQFAHSGGRTVFSGDNDEDDLALPVESNVTSDFAASRDDNNSTILRVGANADVHLSSLTLSSAFNNTTADADFGGISVGEDASLTAVSTTIRACATVYSAALDAESGSTIELDQVLVEYNDSFGGTGALSAHGATINVKNGSVFRHNRSVNGGAIWLEGSSLEATDSQFVQNQAYSSGGAIDVSDAASDALLYNNLFEENVSSLGGAIAVFEGSIFMEVCDFMNNEAAGYGGSIYGSAGDLEIVQNTFEGGTASSGGEVSVWDGNIEFLGNIFWGGSASVGGNVHANDCASFRASGDFFFGGTAQVGGQIYAEGRSVSIEEAVFLGGNADNAGTLFFIPATDGTTNLTISRSSIVGSTATEASSVLSAMGAPFLIDTSTFVDNGTPGVPLIATFGGPGGDISRSTFLNNTGEGVLHAVGTNMRLTDSYIGTHTSQTSGALSAVSGSNLTLLGVTLAENTTNGESTPVLTLVGGSELSFNNSVLWASASATDPWFSVDPNGASAAVDSSCGPAELAALGTSTTLTSSPFVEFGTLFPLLQSPASPCLGQGSDTGKDYSVLSTVVPFASDVSPVDPGYHYQSTTPLTQEFSVTATQATWNITDPDSMGCRLAVPSERVLIWAGASGTFDHSFVAGTDFYLFCKESNGDNAPVVLSASL